MKIGFKNRQLVKVKIDIGKVEKLIKEIIRKDNKELGEIEIVFLKDEEVLEINKKFLKHNYFTDVISFDYNRRNKIFGDICISVDRVKENALKYKEDYHRELMRVIAHGVLHLIGYKDMDQESKGKMREKENFFLNFLDSLQDEKHV